MKRNTKTGKEKSKEKPVKDTGKKKKVSHRTIKTGTSEKARKDETGKDKQKKSSLQRNITLFTAALLCALILTTALLSYAAKKDISFGEPVAFVNTETTEILNTKYFAVVLRRFPLSAQTYNPDNNTLNYTLGIDASQDRLNFGIIPIGSPASKQLKLANDRADIVKIKSCIYGNISKHITLEDNNFILDSGQKKDLVVQFSSTEPDSAFTGELDVMVIIPTPQDSLLSKIMLKLV